MAELERQLGDAFPDHIVMACGSGGTAAGVALGVRLSGLPTVVTAIGVCDTPKIFYDHIRATAAALGANPAEVGDPESWLRIHDGQGLGYSMSSPEELRFITGVSAATGVVLDPVYSGKALFNFIDVAAANPDLYRRGQSVLFIHTGGGMALSAHGEALTAAHAVPGSVSPLSPGGSKL